MSNSQYEEAVGIIRNYGGDFDGNKPTALVGKAEAALGLIFPPTYKRFLLELGCGDIAGEEIYGVIDDNFTSSTIPNGIWLTLQERRDRKLGNEFVIVSVGSDGMYYAIDTSRIRDGEENPIVLLDLDNNVIEETAPTFGAFLLDIVKRVAR